MISFHNTYVVRQQAQLQDQHVLTHTMKQESRILITVLILALLLQFQFVLSFNINWDEFFYLSKVHKYLAGDVMARLQSLHVHAFTWLTRVSDNEVNQIVSARLVMLLLHSLTAFFLYRIAHRATDRPSALFAVLSYLSISYVIRGGSSFRTDPIAIFFILAAFELVVFLHQTAVRTLFAGILFAIAAMVTIKTAIFFPSFLFILILPVFMKDRRREAILHSGLGLSATVLAFATLYWLHDFSLATTPTPGLSNTASNGFAKTLWDAGFFPQFYVFLNSLFDDLAIWAFIIAGGMLTIIGLRPSRNTDLFVRLEILALAVPFATLLIYRNSFPYFYAFLLAPVSILVAVAWQSLGTHLSEGRARISVPTIKYLAIGIIIFNMGMQCFLGPRDKPLEHQRQILHVIHQIFPKSVPYFDRSSLVASFPQAGFLMSTWGMESYQSAGNRIFAKAIMEKEPPFLVADHPVLDLEHKVYKADSYKKHNLFEEDYAALKNTYIHHWGPIYVAGTKVLLEDPVHPRTATISVGGPYTLEAESPVMIAGRIVQPGESVMLSQGSHEISSPHTSLPVTLRWGQGLNRPSEPAPDKPIFLGF